MSAQSSPRKIFTPSMNWLGFPLAWSASMRMSAPLFSRARGIFFLSITVGGISRKMSERLRFSAASNSMSRTIANMPSKAGWNRGNTYPPLLSPTKETPSRVAVSMRDRGRVLARMTSIPNRAAIFSTFREAVTGTPTLPDLLRRQVGKPLLEFFLRLREPRRVEVGVQSDRLDPQAPEDPGEDEG